MTSARDPEPAASLITRDLNGRGLRIEFFRLTDRYFHRLLAVGCEELPVPLLESCEGDASDPWPPSPALRGLNVDDLCDFDGAAAVPPAMLVGMSGSTHWSMSVQPCSSSDSNVSTNCRVGFAFDVAGRVKVAPQRLGSWYSLGRRVQSVPNNGEITLQFGSGVCLLRLLALDSSADDAGWQLDARRREVLYDAPIELALRRLPATVRWRYAVYLLDG